MLSRVGQVYVHTNVRAPHALHTPMAMEPKPDQPLADQPIVVNDEGTVLSTSDGGAEDGGASPSRRRRSSMRGRPPLKSARCSGDFRGNVSHQRAIAC